MKKKVIIIVCIVIFVLMLLPFRIYHIKDGGSVEYKAILYSVTKVKTLSNCETTQYSKGWRIKIFGKEIIDLVDYIACDKDNQARDNKINIRTDIEPIYNHFPSLPKTDKIEWYATSSNGIGLVTYKLYAFAKYDDTKEIDELFLIKSSDSDIYVDVDFGFKSKYLKDDDKWVKTFPIIDFQDGIKETNKMNVSAYVNEDHTVIYFEAIGD